MNQSINKEPIITDRLIMDQLNETDIPDLYPLLKDETVNKFLPWFPVRNIEETQDFFETRIRREPYFYGIFLKENRELIGYVHVGDDEAHDFGYALKKEYWHQGYATEASQSVLKKLQELNFPYITATHDRENSRSGKVMKQLGMTYQYSYEEDWQPKNIPVIFRMYQLNLKGDKDFVYKKYWENSMNHFIEEVE